MINVSIAVNTAVNEGTPDAENISVSASGKYIYSGSEARIAYDEAADGTVTHCRVTVKDNAAEIVRRGAVSCHMTVLPNIVTPFIYNTPYGAIHMACRGSSITCSLEKDGGEIELHYDILSDGQCVSQNRITIKIKKI